MAREEDNETGKKEGRGADGAPKKTRKHRGPKGTNPLSVKKPKKRPKSEGSKSTLMHDEEKEKELGAVAASLGAEEGPEPSKKRKRRRKHKSRGDGASEA
jgi:U3 small nucleolar RNA-associated protein 23